MVPSKSFISKIKIVYFTIIFVFYIVNIIIKYIEISCLSNIKSFFSSSSKLEFKNVNPATAGILANAGCHVCIVTDAPVVPLQGLPLFAGMAVKAGMDPYDALRAVTINAAEHLGIADRVGSLEPGKDGDVVITAGSPFTVEGAVRYVLIDGKVIVEQK